jgi:ubiquinone/menaquinone biosynthesis C-methylase UbiE
MYKDSMKSAMSKNFDPKRLDELPIWSAPFGLKLLDYIIYKPNITAIDIGFGSGFPLIEIAMRLGNGSIVYGIDPWKEAIEIVKDKIKYYGISNINIMEGSVESIPLENNSVNLITSNNCINNVGDINKALMECSRILKRNGQFIQTMNLEKSMFEFYNIMENTLLELNLKTEIDLMYKHIEEKRPSIDKILKSMKDAYIIKDIEYDQFNYKFTNGTAMLNHYFVKMAFMGSWKEIVPKDKVEDIFEIVETKLNEQSKTFGEIKLSIPFVLINSIKK